MIGGALCCVLPEAMARRPARWGKVAAGALARGGIEEELVGTGAIGNRRRRRIRADEQRVIKLVVDLPAAPQPCIHRN